MDEARVLAGFRESDSEVLLSRALLLLHPTQKSLCIDIGSGELHVLEYVVQSVGCNCIGIENDPSLVTFSRRKIETNALLRESVAIVEADAEACDLSAFAESGQDTVIFMFLSHFGYSIMGRQILRQMPAGTRVVTVANPVGPYWHPVCMWEGDELTLGLYLYIVNEECKAAAAVCHPTQEERTWKHPPPGSYHPREVPVDVIRIPMSASNENAREICMRNESYQYHTVVKRGGRSCEGACDHNSAIMKDIEAGTGSLPVPIKTVINFHHSDNTDSDKKIEVRVASIPRAPPLPPPFFLSSS